MDGMEWLWDERIKELDGDGSVLEKVESLAGFFLAYYETPGLPTEKRHAAKIMHNRLNVAAYEIRHSLDVVPDEFCEDAIESDASRVIEDNGQVAMVF